MVEYIDECIDLFDYNKLMLKKGYINKKIMLQLLQFITILKKNNIVFGDLSGSNILYNKRTQLIKIIDPGFCVIIDEDDEYY